MHYFQTFSTGRGCGFTGGDERNDSHRTRCFQNQGEIKVKAIKSNEAHIVWFGGPRWHHSLTQTSKSLLQPGTASQAWHMHEAGMITPHFICDITRYWTKVIQLESGRAWGLNPALNSKPEFSHQIWSKPQGLTSDSSIPECLVHPRRLEGQVIKHGKQEGTRACPGDVTSLCKPGIGEDGQERKLSWACSTSKWLHLTVSTFETISTALKAPYLV